MNPLTLAAVVLLVTAQPPLSTSWRLPSGETAELTADTVVYEPERRVFIARGHTQLRSGTHLLRADELTYDQAHQTAVARGNVMFVSGLMAAVADGLSVDLGTEAVAFDNGLLMQKAGVGPEQLLQAKTPQELRDLGQTPVLLSGRRISRTGENAYQVEGIALAPCLCSGGEPSWRIEASRAQVQMGDHVTLSWPVVFVRSAPVLALPWLYLPMGERRSGLLIPRPTTSGLNGFSLEQPFFITLGRSYDLTLTPGIFLGGARRTVVRNLGGVLTERGEPPNFGIKGPRLHTEFRYEPSVGTSGVATLSVLHDGQPIRNPVTADFFLTEQGHLIETPRGLRGGASLSHRQDLGNGWYDRIDASVVSDGFYTRDLVADIIARENQYLRSTGVLYRRSEDHWMGVEVGLRQDIRWGYDLFGRTRVPEGAVGSSFVPGPRTFQKWPALSWVFAERPLGKSPLVGGMRVEFARLAPLTSRFGDEGEDGRFDEFGRVLLPLPDGTLSRSDTLDGAQGNGVFDGADREARDRLELLPRLSSSFALGPFARFSPSLAVRQDFWLGEVSGRGAQRGYPLVDVRVDSRLSRVFDLGDTSLLHTLEPSIALRYVPAVWGGLPSPGARVGAPGQAYDEVDAALPAGPSGAPDRFLHAVIQVHQTLSAKTGSNRRELLRLTLGQGFDLSSFAPSLGEKNHAPREAIARDTFARLSARVNRFSGNAELRIDPNSLQIAQLSTDFRLDVPNAALYARYDDLLGVGSDRLRRSLDALVGPARTSAQRAQFLTGGMQATLGGGLGMRYEAIVQPRSRSESPLSQQSLGVSYGPECNCWRVELLARLGRGQTLPDFGLNLTVTGVGSFGTGG